MASDSDKDFVHINQMQWTHTPPIDPPQYNRLNFTKAQIRRMEQISKTKDNDDLNYPLLRKNSRRFLFDNPKNLPILISPNTFSFPVNSHENSGTSATNVYIAIVQKTQLTQTNPSARQSEHGSEPSPTSSSSSHVEN
ncbi:hypothetical protein TNIN_304621 [Trichonephila inaurata madagascariensis]|uniref:Uncharacterized protein n=1 Tax=Trichonephila inaurata madagascariensis TaxID=2747483 RepID=A0A8X6WLZ1_9ARAC|nr:hypothetical protein TNIN_304621 [Trichonephila inaurata madagascariensis]